MAITVCGNCINFGSQSICVDPTGIYVSGRFDVAGCFEKTQAQGTIAGFTAGGLFPSLSPSPANQRTTDIQCFPFASDSNSVDVGEMEVLLKRYAATSSSTDGYIMGGACVIDNTDLQTIFKFPFASTSNGSHTADLTFKGGRYTSSLMSCTHGYSAGGRCQPPGAYVDTIEKFPFNSDTNATDVGELFTNNSQGTGNSSRENGYLTGGFCSPPFSRISLINKWPFNSDNSASNVGNIPCSLTRMAPASSADHAYQVGGASSPGPSPLLTKDQINKYPFSNESSSIDVGELAINTADSGGHSSSTDGYTSGGYKFFPSEQRDQIQKFPFSSDANSTDIAELTCGLMKQSAPLQV